MKDILEWSRQGLEQMNPCIGQELRTILKKNGSKCATCNKYKNQNKKEPLINHDVPLRAFQKVGVDIFECRGKDYILCVDYYSKFVEIRKLNEKTAKSVQYQRYLPCMGFLKKMSDNSNVRSQ